MKSLALAAVLATTFIQPAWSAQFTIDGEPNAVKLVATGATRADVIAALADRYKFDVVGGTISDGALDGEFSGTLGQVLKAILPANGYALAYRNGRPSRVTFTGAGGTEVATTQTVPIASPPARTVAPAASGDPKPPAVSAAKKAPREVPISSPAPPQNDGNQMKTMTDRAVQQLQELARSIKKIEPQ